MDGKKIGALSEGEAQDTHRLQGAQQTVGLRWQRDNVDTVRLALGGVLEGDDGDIEASPGEGAGLGLKEAYVVGEVDGAENADSRRSRHRCKGSVNLTSRRLPLILKN